MKQLIKDIERAYLLGIGGIGMSALARYLNASGIRVAGYDRVSTLLTDELVREGIEIFHSGNSTEIPEEFRNKEKQIVIYTPAIPEKHPGFRYFRENDFSIVKRSEFLGKILENYKAIAVAGTHGKTTVSTIIAHILNESELKCNAFLGGISKNLQSNLLLSEGAEYAVAEADEFDRSFLQLSPHIAVVTSIDADHLDIYGNYENLRSSYQQFISNIRKGGILIFKKGLNISIPEEITGQSFSMTDESADFFPEHVQRKGFHYCFNLKTPEGIIESLELKAYGRINLENTVTALAVASNLEIHEDVLRKALQSYCGVKRRFDVRIQNEKRIYIDDYAHHPEELKAFIYSVKEALPGKKITGLFQPHLYSRTKDFAAGFANSLSLLDDVILLDIYPAREDPIEGVTTRLIFDRLENPGEKLMINKEQLMRVLTELNPAVLLSMGAGDIDQLVEPIGKLMKDMS